MKLPRWPTHWPSAPRLVDALYLMNVARGAHRAITSWAACRNGSTILSAMVVSLIWVVSMIPSRAVVG
jgi:hypothetical protein